MTYRRCHHCIVWMIVGTRRLVCCAHCDLVLRDDEAVAGDGRRADQSMGAHGSRCGRLAAWLVA